MPSSVSADQRFDLSIALGAFVALYWTLYVAPGAGELMGVVLGSLPILAGVYLYVDPEQYVVQCLVGLAAVTLGGGAPATVLYRTAAGDWLVGSQPLPLALGIMFVVVVVAVVGRRSVGSIVASSDSAAV